MYSAQNILTFHNDSNNTLHDMYLVLITFNEKIGYQKGQTLW